MYSRGVFSCLVLSWALSRASLKTRYFESAPLFYSLRPRVAVQSKIVMPESEGTNDEKEELFYRQVARTGLHRIANGVHVCRRSVGANRLKFANQSRVQAMAERTSSKPGAPNGANQYRLSKDG